MPRFMYSSAESSTSEDTYIDDDFAPFSAYDYDELYYFLKDYIAFKSGEIFYRTRHQTIDKNVRMALQHLSQAYTERHYGMFVRQMIMLRVAFKNFLEFELEIERLCFGKSMTWHGVMIFFLLYGEAVRYWRYKPGGDVLVDVIRNYFPTYIGENIEPWIEKNGGWDAFRIVCLETLKMIVAAPE